MKLSVNECFSQINVFSDSIAALLSIKDCNTKNSIARNIQYFVKFFSAFTSVKFYWCKGHNKIIGNEMADYFAKDSISNPNCLNQVFPLPISHVKNKVKSKSKTSWFNRWKTSTNGRITFSFIPDGMPKYLQFELTIQDFSVRKTAFIKC